MGPTIILDKSAYQSLSKEDTFELGRYFYVVVPPVLILEILADLKKPKVNPEGAEAAVRQLANKIQPVDGCVNVDYRALCTANLLGREIEMHRRPIVAGGQRAVAADGTVGLFLDSQPENEALIRWSCGKFAEAEELLAEQWRAASEALDLAALKRQLLGYGHWVPLESLSLVRQVVDEMMALPEAQPLLLDGILRELRGIPEVTEWTFRRWRSGESGALREFAGYAHHCLMVNLIFQFAIVQGLIGTRSTNRIDMEYFCYSPFAHIFCSGDKLHGAMAEVVLGEDQSFVWRDDLRLALREVAEARAAAEEAGEDDWRELEPKEDSLIRQLWVKHLGQWPERKRQVDESALEQKEDELMQRVKPWLEACRKAQQDSPSPPRWPCP